MSINYFLDTDGFEDDSFAVCFGFLSPMDNIIASRPVLITFFPPRYVQYARSPLCMIQPVVGRFTPAEEQDKFTLLVS